MILILTLNKSYIKLHGGNNDISLKFAKFGQAGTLPEKFSYSEFFWSVFSRIRTEYGDILYGDISLDSVRMLENTDPKISEYGHFSRSRRLILTTFLNGDYATTFQK